MPQIVPITKQNHSDKSWNRFSSYTFTAKDNLAPIAAAEIPKAVHAFPLAFVKYQENYTLVALLSLTPGTNMFVAPGGQWLGAYVPSVFRCYPFMLANAEGQEDPVLCVDDASDLIKAEKGAEPFFDEQGELSESVKGIIDFLSKLDQNRRATNQAVAALAEAGVIAEWALKIKDGDQEKPVTGLYCIDEAKLNALDDEQFLTLRKTGSLLIAYSQMLSMGNIQIFQQLTRAHQQLKNPKKADSGPFIGNDDIISFQ